MDEYGLLLEECSTREITKTWSIYRCEVDGGANFQCRNITNGWDVYVLMIEKA